MRYPFASFVVTVGVFACMFLLIFTGELRLFADDAPKPPINVAGASVFCPSDDATTGNVQDFTAEITALCDGKNACEIDSKKLLAGSASTNCMLEMRIEYGCKTKTIYQAKTHTAHIYQRQVASIKCATEILK